MQRLKFKNLCFEMKENSIILSDFLGFAQDCGNFVEAHIAGEERLSHYGAKLATSSEGVRLQYVDAKKTENQLKIVQKSPFIKAETVFDCYDDTSAVRITTTVTNSSDKPLVLEEVASFLLSGIGGVETALNPENFLLTRFLQSHHAECQPRCFSLKELGLSGMRANGQQRICGTNIGSWSTKEELPQAILENQKTGDMLMFQIESNASWYYEISDKEGTLYLHLGGANQSFGNWSINLLPGESYTTPTVALTVGKSINEVVADMTLYRRHYEKNFPSDAGLPSIFNEYMHLSWDNPTAETTAMYAPVVAKTGVEYYVIDCGWHNEEDGNKVYPYVGQWKESQARFPEGVRKTTDLIRSLGMKPGLWIEPEVIGVLCRDMTDFYDDDCYISRYGKKVSVNRRYFLDYRNEKVRTYMTETIQRMVEDYGADYIKFDYNQDCGAGTDINAFSLGRGLELCADAFLDWVEELRQRFPDVIFEGCASGGMRMDHKTLSHFSLISTSDQTSYLNYPYIAGNILSAVLPEQAAVWSYPMAGDCQTSEDLTDKRIAMNMINSFLGRMHLASHLEKLNEHQLALIKEGVAYYNSLTAAKKRAVPYFPNGFCNFGDNFVCAGFRDENHYYIAVWCLQDDKTVTIPFDNKVLKAEIAYPSYHGASLTVRENEVNVIFDELQSAVFLEIDTN